MGNSYLRMPKNSRPINITLVGADYLGGDSVQDKEEKLGLIENIARSLSMPKVFGVMDNLTYYLTTIELLMSGSFEWEHCRTIFKKEVIDKMNNFTNLLDIGIGSGKMTKFVAEYFYNITLVDVNYETLKSIPDNYNNKTVNKIHKSILDLAPAIQPDTYNMILLSHTLYYIEEKYRVPLFKSLYQALPKDGVLVIIYNDQLGKNKLSKHFGGRENDFNEFLFYVLSNYKNCSAFQEIEIIESRTIEPMLHIASLMLSDTGATAKYEDLVNYINENVFRDHDENDQFIDLPPETPQYQIDMKGNFIFCWSEG